ncbi:glycosyl hydrolase 115 family protein [Plebeiibacterium sediminum]|uniref:Glycosyl hydrolase 115 family protein n=1 Tax=Plebeiibacterium sediminum TaxID=2992112 RepID=A0AAE3M506_9BACT|nr:glycosyl hydrolase 115 family protein [Plebeiobacterium sediminum]MCW3787376.1 glycosyl hydrolase 115 family protein [Plebeiobacterium sediminum]
MRQLCFWALALLVIFQSCTQKESEGFVVSESSKSTRIVISNQCDSLIGWAIEDVAASMKSITGSEITLVETSIIPTQKNNEPCLIIGQFSDSLIQKSGCYKAEDFTNKWEQFQIKNIDNQLFIVGSDVRGVVYGIFDMAERIGISPWIWWADVQPTPQKQLALQLPAEGITQSPSVQYRGIFLNDEDWGLHPWAAKTFEPETNDIGPKTYEKIFQLLLKLKANTIWPAMHPCTKAFYTIEGNKEIARKYHIMVSTSHAEPMMRNNVDEWKHDERGDFNYFTNSNNVKQYWQERIDELIPGKDHFIATIGMRGVHDGKMEGNATTEQKIEMLGEIVDTQRKIMANSFNSAEDSVPQLFIPYKEVLDLYNKGFRVPDDVTLMWTDDNYGYIRRFSNDEEQKRSGGSGVYYHLSYWGRPHDYLWLSTTSPALTWYEMNRAYQNGADKIWIANVGDIKPTEYNMELFLDMAWDINSVTENNLSDHMFQWAKREFGAENASAISHIMDEYYHLAFLRRPEFMGWSRTEPTTQTYLSQFNTRANGNELQKRIDRYTAIVRGVDKIKQYIPEMKQDAFFELVEYPVKAASLMNEKFLYYQLAAEADTKKAQDAYYQKSTDAYNEIKVITDYYNQKLANGKWMNMMDMQPRNLPAFKMPLKPESLTKDVAAPKRTVKPQFIQSATYTKAVAPTPYHWISVEGLGYSKQAITVYPFNNHTFDDSAAYVSYDIEIPETGNYDIEIRCLPTHSNEFNHQLSVQVGTFEKQNFLLNTKGRSNAWKDNVLRNYTAVHYKLSDIEAGKYTLKLGVNQTGIVIDQIAVNPENTIPYYEIPVE